MTAGKCVICAEELIGRQTRFCSKLCRQRHRSQLDSANGKSHKRYLDRKAAGYYASKCVCGRKKHRDSEHCMVCERGRISAPRCSDCGVPIKGYSSRCRRCAHKGQVVPTFAKDEKGRFTGRLYDNPYCPNEEGKTNCMLMQPHNHCKYCSWPIKESEGMCADCIRAVERGACMTARDSRQYERLAA